MEKKIKKYGLLGFSLKHSFSPAMHNAAFEKFGINGQYFLFEKKNSQLDEFLKNLKKEGITGINVTVPYKEEVLSRLDWVSEDAASIGAVNTVVAGPKGLLKGFNTDWTGFLKEIKDFGRCKNAKVALLGAGGAARAVSYALVREGAQKLVIFDINSSKAAALAKDGQRWAAEKNLKIEIKKIDNLGDLNLAEKDLLVNATPMGLKEDDPLLIEKNKLHPNLMVYDLIYNPSLTKLLGAAKEKGLKFVNGLGMLVYQGAQSFLIFTGAQLSLEEVASVMRGALLKELP